MIPPPPPPPRNGFHRLGGRFRAALGAGGLALGAFASAPAFGQVGVGVTSSPANGAYYVTGENITTRLSVPQLGGGNVQAEAHSAPQTRTAEHVPTMAVARSMIL